MTDSLQAEQIRALSQKYEEHRNSQATFRWIERGLSLSLVLILVVFVFGSYSRAQHDFASEELTRISSSKARS